MEPKRIVILGTGGNCLDILDALLSVNRHAGRPVYECAGFLDDNPATHGEEFGGVPVLGPLRDAPRFADCRFINGIGSPRNFQRKPEIVASTGVSVERFETIIHPLASVSGFARIGRGCVLLAGAVVGARAVLSDHVLLLQGAIVSHDCQIAAHVSITSGACLAGGVRVGECSYIGANACIRGSLTVGPRTLVGMGSVVLHDVAADSVVAGNPARPLPPTEPSRETTTLRSRDASVGEGAPLVESRDINEALDAQRQHPFEG